MKKLILVLVMVLAFNQSNAQDIEKYVDEMSEKVYWFSTDSPLFEISSKEGFILRPSLIGSKRQLEFRGFNVKSVGLGCMEDATLIILFEDKTKITLTSWNDFNCDGNSYFTLTKAQKEDLRIKRISKVRLTNGRTYDNFTAPIEQPDYFIQIQANIEADKYTVVTDVD